MTIFTTYYSMVGKIPKELTPIAISRVVPKFFNGLVAFDLAPSWELLMASKQGLITKEEYILRYRKEVLGKLTPEQVIESLPKNSILFCYEGLDKFCHRHLVSEWLRGAGYDVEELVLN